MFNKPEWVSDHIEQVYYIPKESQYNLFLGWGWIVAIPILIFLFVFSFAQINPKFLRVLVVTLILYSLLLYVTFFSAASCVDMTCSTGKNLRLETWLALVGGYGIFAFTWVFMFLNGLLLATKKAIASRFLYRFGIGMGAAFILWLTGTIVLLAFGIGSGN